jgi:hypothetical protein
MGIKVGGLYKRTGRGSSRAPLALVVEMENWYHQTGMGAKWAGVQLLTLEDGKLQYSWLSKRSATTGRPGINVDGDAWPYKELAAPA